MGFRENAEFDSAETFLDYLESEKFFPVRKGRESVYWDEHLYVFRGLSDSDWRNDPTAFRNGDPFLDYTPQPTGPDLHGLAADKESILLYIGWHLQAEMRAVWLFLRAADAAGIQTPIDYATVSDGSDIVNAYLKGREPEGAVTWPPKTFMAAVALARHHGVPARLLDCSNSPLVAAFMAAYDVVRKRDEGEPVSERLSVHFIHKRHIKKLEMSLVSSELYRNDFLRAQRAVFLNIDGANDYFLEHRKWPSLEDWIAKFPRAQSMLSGQANVPTSEAESILRILWHKDITPAHLMPMLANAANAFKYKRRLFGI